jgi:hypothetical protein
MYEVKGKIRRCQQKIGLSSDNIFYFEGSHFFQVLSQTGLDGRQSFTNRWCTASWPTRTSAGTYYLPQARQRIGCNPSRARMLAIAYDIAGQHCDCGKGPSLAVTWKLPPTVVKRPAKPNWRARALSVGLVIIHLRFSKCLVVRQPTSSWPHWPWPTVLQP